MQMIHLLDWVDLVWGWDGDSSGDWDLVWLGDLLLDNDLTGDSSGHSDGDINVVLVDLDLGDDVGDLGGDPGVGSDWSSNPGLGHGVSWSGTSGDWSWRNGSVGSWSSGDDWGGQSSGLNKVLGSSGNIGGGWLRDVLNSSNSVLVTSNNTDLASLDSSLSNNTVDWLVLNNSGSSSVAVVSLTNHSWSMSDWSTDHLTSVAQAAHSNVRGSSHGNSQEGTANLGDNIIIIKTITRHKFHQIKNVVKRRQYHHHISTHSQEC